MTAFEVKSFLNQMDSDMIDFKKMYQTEENLIKAIQEYEHAWKVKIKMPLALEEVTV